jgi:hypothetical protein
MSNKTCDVFEPKPTTNGDKSRQGGDDAFKKKHKCWVCKGRGEIKSYCDEPDSICSHCSGTGIDPELPSDKEFWEV